MLREIFRDIQDEVDLRTIGANMRFMQKEVRRVRGLHAGQVISYHNRAGTRFRHLMHIPALGGVKLVISPFDPDDKYTLPLKESESLARMTTLQKHQTEFERIAGNIRARKERSDALKKAKRKAKRKGRGK